MIHSQVPNKQVGSSVSIKFNLPIQVETQIPRKEKCWIWQDYPLVQTLGSHEHDLGPISDLRLPQRHSIHQKLPYHQTPKTHKLKQNKDQNFDGSEKLNQILKQESKRRDLWRWAFDREGGHWWEVEEGTWGLWWLRPEKYLWWVRFCHWTSRWGLWWWLR